MISIKYITEKDTKLIQETLGVIDMYIPLYCKSYGFKIMILRDDKPEVIGIAPYGNKDKSAYIAYLWTSGSSFSKKALARIVKAFNILHYGWFVVFRTQNIKLFKNHSKPYNKKLHQYTGCL